jgi:type III pantothenate kinase
MKTPYLLAIDIGNTTTVAGFYEEERLVNFFRLSSKHTLTADEAGILIGHLQNHQVQPRPVIGGVIICSVVPSLTPVYQEMARRYFHCEAIVVTCDLRFKVKIKTDDPRQVGADRIANAEAFVHKYDGAGIIVDFGTATTFDVISAAGEYLGGAIAPGIETSSARLSERAARLFKVKLEAPRRVIGADTEDALKSGLLYGTIGQVEGIIRRITDELGEKPTIIATGGLASTIAAETNLFDAVDDTLTLFGLCVIYKNNR